jgi:chorismate mutase/prephenate dehydrogenase
MADLFGDLGHAVMIVDLDTALTAEEAAASADVIVVSVPIDATVALIERIGPLVHAEALLLDVTSVKAAPMAAMLSASEASVVGTHPLFGPSVHSLQGQRIVLTPGRGDTWLAWLKQMLHARGLNVLESTPEDHDAAMAVVQVLVHFATEVMGTTLARLGVSIEKTLAFTSPIYLLELFMTARHFGQSPELYASIQMANPETPRVTEAFLQSATDLRERVMAGDHAAVAEAFGEVRALFGDFAERAMAQSDYLIDRLVERT